MGNRYLLTVRADKWVLFCPSAPGIKQTTFFLSTVFNVVAHHLFSAKDFKIQTKTWLQSDGWLSPYSGKLFSLFHITFYNRKNPNLKWLQGNPSEKADYLLAMLIFISLSFPSGTSAVPLALKEEALQLCITCGATHSLQNKNPNEQAVLCSGPLSPCPWQWCPRPAWMNTRFNATLSFQPSCTEEHINT